MFHSHAGTHADRVCTSSQGSPCDCGFPHQENDDTRADARPVGCYCISYTSPNFSPPHHSHSAPVLLTGGVPPLFLATLLLPSTERLHFCYMFRIEDIILSPECLFFTAPLTFSTTADGQKKGTGIHSPINLLTFTLQFPLRRLISSWVPGVLPGSITPESTYQDRESVALWGLR